VVGAVPVSIAGVSAIMTEPLTLVDFWPSDAVMGNGDGHRPSSGCRGVGSYRWPGGARFVSGPGVGDRQRISVGSEIEALTEIGSLRPDLTGLQAQPAHERGEIAYVYVRARRRRTSHIARGNREAEVAFRSRGRKTQVRGIRVLQRDEGPEVCCRRT